MEKFSKNKKLNGVLVSIYNDLMELGKDEIIRYYNEFPQEPDYNIAQYGNLLIYYSDIMELYKSNGYKIENYPTEKLWSCYKRQVGYLTNLIVKNF